MQDKNLGPLIQKSLRISRQSILTSQVTQHEESPEYTYMPPSPHIWLLTIYNSTTHHILAMLAKSEYSMLPNQTRGRSRYIKILAPSLTYSVTQSLCLDLPEAHGAEQALSFCFGYLGCSNEQPCGAKIKVLLARLGQLPLACLNKQFTSA